MGHLTSVRSQELLTAYLAGRAIATLRSYNTGYRRLREFCKERRLSLFRLGEGEMVSLVIAMADQGCSEGAVKQILAVVNLV